jgi:cyclohexyl-isocyanide hydratase
MMPSERETVAMGDQRADSELKIGLLAFPDLTQLDLTGPYETFARIPGARVHVLWKTEELVRSDRGLFLKPTVTYRDCPPLDVLCVPGGPGVNDAMLDEETLAFVRRQAKNARYITSVCSGALILGAAGLLRGYRATTHWASLDFLSRFGAIPVRERVCKDRNRITGGGVTAGIDFGIYMASQLAGDAVAQRIQLYLEYAPAPPFDAGSPERVPDAVLAAYREAATSMLKQRAGAVEIAAAALERA